MQASSRASTILGLFVALALTPLAIAAAARHELGARDLLAAFGVAAGFVAFALLALEFALVARVRWVSEPFGTDALALFHRQMALVALAFALAHAGLLGARGHASWSSLDPLHGAWGARAGAIALWSACLLVASALVRRKLPISYELWRASHRLLAIAIVAGMLAHALLAGSASRALPVRSALWAFALFVLVLVVRHRLLRPLALRRAAWEIVENRDQGSSTRTLVLEPRGHAGLVFEAGQFVWLITGRTPFAREQHPLSIASSALVRESGRVELAIKALGDWSSTEVPALRAGTRVWLDGPFGGFTPERVAAPGFVLIAGGIGITPMRSIALTLRERGDPRPVILFHAARNRERAVFASELAALENQRFQWIAVFEERDPDPRAELGFIDAALLARHLPAGFERWAFFVCGPPPMMDAIERALTELGVDPERVHSERFDRV